MIERACVNTAIRNLVSPNSAGLRRTPLGDVKVDKREKECGLVHRPHKECEAMEIFVLADGTVGGEVKNVLTFSDGFIWQVEAISTCHAVAAA
jgi:hypothetical protein